MSRAASRGSVRPAKLLLRINGEEYIAYGLMDEQDGYIAFEVELLVKKSGDGYGRGTSPQDTR